MQGTGGPKEGLARMESPWLPLCGEDTRSLQLLEAPGEELMLHKEGAVGSVQQTELPGLPPAEPAGRDDSPPARSMSVSSLAKPECFQVTFLSAGKCCKGIKTCIAGELKFWQTTYFPVMVPP